MAKISLYNTVGKQTGDIELSDAVFAVKPKKSVVHQVFLALSANQREPWAHTQNKGEVRGGGKKPWKQKGTGRARHGSIRSPLWKGGGVTFGPRNIRSYVQKINKKMNRLAVRMMLSDRLKNDHLFVVDTFPTDGKTQTFVALRSALPGLGKTTLVVTRGKDENVLRALASADRIDVVRAEDVNVMDLMNHQYVIVSKDAVAGLEERLA